MLKLKNAYFCVSLAFFSVASLLPNVSLADYQKNYTVIDSCYNSDGGCAVVKGADGKYDVKYSSKIGAENGDTVTVLFSDDDKWRKITRDRTGITATVTSIYKY
jgi:hypothetical protein